jgi:hypothetical protein
VTRAQAHADLVLLNQAACNLAVYSNVDYPEDIRAAEGKFSTADPVANTQISGNADAAGMRECMSGTSAGGSWAPTKRICSGSACVDPVTFCTPYFLRKLKSPRPTARSQTGT